MDVPSWPSQLSLSLPGPLSIGSWTSLSTTPPAGLGEQTSINTTVHIPGISEISLVAKNIVVNVMQFNDSGLSTRTTPKLLPGAATIENERVVNQLGLESPTVVALNPGTNQARGAATSNRQVAVWRQEIG